MEPIGYNQETQIQVYVFPTMPIRTIDDIEIAVNSHPNTKVAVQRIGQIYQTINIEDSIKKLKQIGTWLQLAYCGSKGHACSSKLIRILGEYQPLVNKSTVVASTFVETCLKALTTFRYARLSAEKGAISQALTMISKTGTLADAMAKLSEDLVNQSQILCTQSMDALEALHMDEVSTKGKAKKADDEYKKLQVQQDKLTEQTKNLIEAVEEAKQEEARLIKEANKIRQQAFTVSIVKGVIQPIASAGATIASSLIPAAGIGKIVNTMSGLLSKDTKKNEGSASTKIGGDLQSSLNKILETQGKVTGELAKINKNIEQEKISLLELKGKLALETDIHEQKKLEGEITLAEERIKTFEATVPSKQKMIEELKESLVKITNLLSNQIKNLEDKEGKIAQQRADLQKEWRDANAKLVGTITELKHSVENVDHLNQSIKSLEIAVKTLGKVKIVFENTALFWTNVKRQCVALANFDNINEASEVAELAPEYKIEFINSINYTGLNWLSLAQMTRKAFISMQEVKISVDNIMDDLPTEKEAIKLINSLSDEMLAQIKEEDKIVEIA